MNILISVGCDSYESMGCLAGAEADAKAIFELLTGSGEPYLAEQSVLLLSPTLQQVRDVLSDSFPLRNGCDGITFFFAGHGGIAGGNFYLCLRDSQSDKLSITSMGIIHLFSIINDFAPALVNIVIDACAAGGSSFDLGALIKPEITGSSASSSVAFLGACGADQNASETGGNGFLTVELLRVLKGEVEVQARAEMLDLLEVGAVVSPLVVAANSEQRPISWGLSLFGGSRFAKNPFYFSGSSPRHFPLPEISPFSAFGSKIRERSGELWEIHRELPTDFNPRRLGDALASILEDAGTAQEKLALVKGLGSSLSSRATESEDLLAPSLCLSTCLVSLLPYVNESDIEAYLHDLLAGLCDRNAQLQSSLLQSIKQDEHFLLSPHAFAGDLYYLPLRVTKLLGWVAADLISQRLIPNLRRNSSVPRALVEELISQYFPNFVAVSDEQAAPLYAFFLACRMEGWDGLAKEVLTSIYGSFCDRKGNVTRVGAPVDQSVRYILSLSQSILTPSDWRSANPTNLLPVLLLWASAFGIEDDWDLRVLDRLSMSFFIPEDPRDFSKATIEDGINNVYQIGFGVWKIAEFNGHYRSAIQKALQETKFKISPGGQVQCLLSSLLFPDRVPFFVGASHQFSWGMMPHNSS
jgi:hypothetical protein